MKEKKKFTVVKDTVVKVLERIRTKAENIKFQREILSGSILTVVSIKGAKVELKNSCGRNVWVSVRDYYSKVKELIVA